MSLYDGQGVLDKIATLLEKSRRAGTNVIHYKGPELGRTAISAGQRNIYGGYNWDTRVRNRSAKYTVTIGSPAVEDPNPKAEQVETLQKLDLFMTRIFGGRHEGKDYRGHVNFLPIDLVHRVMGSGADPDFTFNCYYMVTTKNRANHHLPFMWGKMLLERDPVPEAEDLYLLMVPEILTGDFGRFYCFPEQNVTVGVGSDYMGEVKKGFLRMAMFRAKRKNILGIHAGSKVVVARSAFDGELYRYGVVIFGLSGTGKTTNVGHTHFLDGEGEQSRVVQDDFVGIRIRDGRVLGTEQAMFLKTDLDEDDMLLRPATQSAEFVAENMYFDYWGKMHYLEEDLCANGRAILPLTCLPESRRYGEIDLPPVAELDGLFIFFNTRRNTVVPVLQELTAEQAAVAFMLGESIETAAGDPALAGRSRRVVGTNPFIIGPPEQEGNLFYEFLCRHGSKIRCFLMNTGGVGEIQDPRQPGKLLRPPSRPWKSGIGYVTRAVFRNTAVWADDPDSGTRVLVGGVTGERGEPFDMDRFDPRQLYDQATRERLVEQLRRERREYMARFSGLDPEIMRAVH
ncbi:MAG: phosphoenolpyruvate carboxykinase (ATP) [bacterium]